MMRVQTPGQIVTFYSYKGGTGRSMALANVACLLARHNSESGRRRVLIVDWDLEAPGPTQVLPRSLLEREIVGVETDRRGIGISSRPDRRLPATQQPIDGR
jgi:Mrp family chromosome partitioning ATPase